VTLPFVVQQPIYVRLAVADPLSAARKIVRSPVGDGGRHVNVIEVMDGFPNEYWSSCRCGWDGGCFVSEESAIESWETHYAES
jgi:hypothetical protein